MIITRPTAQKKARYKFDGLKNMIAGDSLVWVAKDETFMGRFRLLVRRKFGSAVGIPRKNPWKDDVKRRTVSIDLKSPGASGTL